MGRYDDDGDLLWMRGDEFANVVRRRKEEGRWEWGDEGV